MDMRTFRKALASADKSVWLFKPEEFQSHFDVTQLEVFDWIIFRRKFPDIIFLGKGVSRGALFYYCVLGFPGEFTERDTDSLTREGLEKMKLMRDKYALDFGYSVSKSYEEEVRKVVWI